MYHVDSQHEKVYVVTHKELIFLLIVFIAILTFLYPKDLLKQQIQSETSNYDLSMLYLENLLRHSPDDESLQLILAEQSLRNGKRERSLKLLTLLHKSKNIKYKKKALLLSYELYKLNYSDSKEDKYRKKLKKLLATIFKTIFDEKLADKEDNNRWYNEAVFNQNNEAIYYYLEKKIVTTPKNIKLLESAYYLASNLGKKKDKVKYLKELMNYDKERYEYWLDAYYYTLLVNKKFQKSELLLKGQAKRSSIWQKKLAEFYFMRKSFHKSSLIYRKLFNKTKKYKEKKNYFFNVLTALQAGGLVQESASFGHKYENYYIRDKEVRKFLLKLYIATGNLEHGATLSRKILKSMRK